jgi:steroid delta-isomerase-like uncharacterized protein
MNTATHTVIAAYYAAFNTGDIPAFLDLLTDDVRHDINQSGTEIGKQAFATFLHEMNRCYKETITDIVILADASGTRAAAEFVVQGEYLQTQEGLPTARNQKYTLPAGAFFTLRDGKICRISSYYNLPGWLAQVS